MKSILRTTAAALAIWLQPPLKPITGRPAAIDGDTLKFHKHVDAEKGVDYDQVWQECTTIGQEGDA